MRPLNFNTILWIVTAILILFSLYLVFAWVPTEATMGIVQRIFYFHVPSAWVAFLAFFVVFLSSIFYLAKRTLKWDILAYCSAEIGVVFTSLALISGAIWAKPTWLSWWPWEDPRLTTTLMLWLIYVGYLLVRNYSPSNQSARFAAVIGIAGFLDVPIIYLSVILWRSSHPMVFQPGPSSGLAPSMFLTLMVSLAAFTALYVTLMRLVLSLRRAELEVEELKIRIQD